MVEAGHVRINRIKTTKPAHAVKADDILTITIHGSVRVVRVLGEAERRGPARAARQLYADIGLEKNEGATANALC